MRIKRSFWVIAACLAVLGIATAVYFLIYLPKKERDALQALCGGTAETRYVQRVIGSGDLSAEPDDSNRTEDSSELVECSIETPKAKERLRFEVGDESDASDVLVEMRHDDVSLPASTSAPIGAGWPGVVTVQKRDTAHATVILPCTAKGEDARVVVNVSAQLWDVNLFEDRGKTADLARTATGTAEKSARQRGCGNSTQGGAVGKRVAQTPSGVLHPQDMAQAAGSCSFAREIAGKARKWGIESVAATTPDRVAPVEECLLLNEDGDAVYRLTALHDVLAKAYGGVASLRKVSGDSGRDERNGGWAWGSASCGDGKPRSLYTVSNLHGGNVEFFETSPSFEREALEAFADWSTGRRQCTGLELP